MHDGDADRGARATRRRETLRHDPEREAAAASGIEAVFSRRDRTLIIRNDVPASIALPDRYGMVAPGTDSTWANAATAFLDVQARARCCDRRRSRHPTARVTYRELVELTNRTGNMLRDAGVEPEQRVAMLLPDGIDCGRDVLRRACGSAPSRCR